MSLQFARSNPLQAGKLLAIVVIVPVALGVFFGFLPHQSTTSLFLLPLLSLGLVFAVFVELLLVGFRYLQSGTLWPNRAAPSFGYRLVRLWEIVAAIGSVGAFAVIIARLPDGPMAGPGAIGLWLLMVGLSSVIVVGSFIRAMAEYYRFRRDG